MPKASLDTPDALRRLALDCQGLLHKQAFGKGREGTLRAIEQLAYIQIDTLAVIERAHHHVLWTRQPDYRPEYLQQLVAERKVFEYWFHAASYLPMRDYRYALVKMATYKNGSKPYFSAITTKMLDETLARVRADGPLKLRDFKNNKTQPGSWWNWGPAKQALEKLFMQGDLMVVERNGMEKIYDITERVVPSGINLQPPSLPEYAQYLVNSTLTAHGLASWKQFIYLISDKKLQQAIRTEINERISAGTLISIGEVDRPLGYAQPEMLEISRRQPSGVRILSPFDNALIHRERLQQLFDFDYRLECYLPALKRVYGYFCLPLLMGDVFVGRMDCKAHRVTGCFEVINLYLENKAVPSAEFIQHFAAALEPFTRFNGCTEITVSNTLPKNLRQEIRRVLV